MKPQEQSFLIFELVSGDILADLTLEVDGTAPVDQLNHEARTLAKDFGLNELDVVWVEYIPEKATVKM